MSGQWEIYWPTTTDIESGSQINYTLHFLPTKFCRWMLFEAGRALFMKKHVLFMKKHVYLRKTSKVLTLNAVYAQQVSCKTVTKSLADSVIQFAILGAYTRRANRKHFRFY